MQGASEAGWRRLDGGRKVAGDLADESADSRERLSLVLLPGTLCDRRVFDPLIQRLSARKLIVLEITGASSTNALAVQLLAVAPERFALLGFSLGGILALEMTALAPHRIAGLALLNTNPRSVAPQDHEPRRGQAELARRMGLGPYVGQVLWPSYVAASSAQSEALRNVIVDMAQGLGHDVFKNQIEVALSRVDSRARLSRITAPTLLLSGERDEICTLDMQDEMAEALPNAKLAIIGGAGHFAVLEAPEVVAMHVRAWLEVVDADARRSHDMNQVERRTQA